MLAADRSGPRFSLVFRRELGGNNSENFLLSRRRQAVQRIISGIGGQKGLFYLGSF
jgi:hypothetical protein